MDPPLPTLILDQLLGGSHLNEARTLLWLQGTMFELNADQTVGTGGLKAICEACFCLLYDSSLAAHGGQLQAPVPVCPGHLHLASPVSVLVEFLLWLFWPPDIFTGDASSTFVHTRP